MPFIGVNRHYLSRRAVIGAVAAPIACGRRKGTGFPGYAFVVNEAGRSVAAIDLTLFRVARRVSLGSEPSQVISLAAHESVFVLTPKTGTVHEIGADTLKPRRSARVGNTAVSMRAAPDGESLWVLASDPGALVRVPFDTFRPAQRIRVSGIPSDFDVSAETSRAAVISRNAHGAILADLEKAGIEKTFDVAGTPGIARFRKDGRMLICGHEGERSLTLLDVPGGNAVVQLPLAVEPANFCFTPNGGQLFITGAGMDAVAIVYPYRTEVAETLLAGRSPAAMAITGDRGLVFISNPDSGEVSVLDVPTHRIIAVVAVGAEPRHIVITPDAQYALVLNQRSGDVAVIRVAAVIDRRTRMAPLFTMIPVGSKPVSAAVRHS